MDTEDRAVQTDAYITPVFTPVKSLDDVGKTSPQQQAIKTYLNSRGINVSQDADASGSSSR